MSGYRFERTDNLGDRTDPLVRMHWRLRISEPYPERWGVLLGDAVTNLRAALDHAFWAAVAAHSGPPSNPASVSFPICRTTASYRRPAKELRPLVAPQIWTIVDSLQPFHGGPLTHTAPLEILRHLSNHDKHRTVQVVSRNSLGLLPIEVQSAISIDVVEQWQRDGPAEDGDVVARLKFRRPFGDHTVDVTPTMAHQASVQISDDPVEYRPLGELMDVLRDWVLGVLVSLDEVLGEKAPENLDLGEEYDSIMPEGGGDHFSYTGVDGKTARWTRPIDSHHSEDVPP